MRQSIYNAARRLLYLRIKTEVLPKSADELHIDPAIPLVYVLEARGWADLRVLEAEAANLGLPIPARGQFALDQPGAAGVYSIKPQASFKDWFSGKTQQSSILDTLDQAAQGSADQQLQFVLVSVFWGRPVAKQRSWWRLLFADSSGLAGRLRKFITILTHGGSTTVKFSPAIPYQRLLSDEQRFDVGEVQRGLRSRLAQTRTATLGAYMQDRDTLIRQILRKPDVKRAIENRREADSSNDYKATLKARKYLEEIVADTTNITIQVMERLLSWFWNKFYSGVDINNTEELKALALDHELVYVPCHRSHIDYLLLSYVIYFEGLVIPYIATGKNLNMPLIGRVLRSGGGFFIRRSFKGNALYSTVLFEYLAELLGRGAPVEYFIEGGRSRTGRLLKPKPGMLAMTVRGFLKYRRKPVAFIPVYIGYEKLMESKAYQNELSGGKKKSENLVDSVRSIIGIRGNFGKVALNFGEPILLNELLTEQSPEWSSEQYNDEARPDWVRSTVSALSVNIMEHINEAAAVNAVNLLATALLATPRQSMDERELAQLLEIYRRLIRYSEYSPRLQMTELNGLAMIKRVEELKLASRREHELGDIIHLEGRAAIDLTYYRNNILHLLALPSLIACCFTNVREMSRADIIALVELAYPFLKAELFLCLDEAQLPQAVSHTLEQMRQEDLLQFNEANDAFVRRGLGTQKLIHLELLAHVLSPTLEVYFLILALLTESHRQPLTRDVLETRSRLIAQRVSMVHELNSPDYADSHLIKNFIQNLQELDYIRLDENGCLGYSESFRRTDRRIRLLLKKSVRGKILQMARSGNLPSVSAAQ